MDKTLGIYIHIPFCASKCGYCDFYSVAGCDRLMPKYQDALVEHIRESYGALKSYYVDSVYFGLTDSEIADTHHITRENVRQLRSRAKRRLRAELGEEEPS